MLQFTMFALAMMTGCADEVPACEVEGTVCDEVAEPTADDKRLYGRDLERALCSWDAMDCIDKGGSIEECVPEGGC